MTPEVRRQLGDPDLLGRAAELGLRDEDLTDLHAVVESVLGSDDHLATVAALADRLRTLIGRVGPDVESHRTDPAYADPYGPGVLPLLALLVTAPAAAAQHTCRGVPEDVSAATLADLGQQVHVHRLTYGTFGLHTHGWLDLVWSGSLFRLGRLQFNLALEQPEGRPDWVLSTHIPQTGPLAPPAVDASLAAATAFFAERFPDHPARWFHCRSWLLDPVLSDRLPGSNLAAFERRWTRYGTAGPGAEDLLFFVFGRRGPVDLATLPTDTALRRLAVDRLARGGGWGVFDGRMAP